MDNLFKVLQTPTKENLHKHAIFYFDAVMEEFPGDYTRIITYINECFNYNSDLLTEEKDWAIFLGERFKANNLPEGLRELIIDYKSPEVLIAVDEFLTHQKQPVFQTLIAKQNLRKDMLIALQDRDAKMGDKATANTLLTTLDDEINLLHERLRGEQKVFGNFKGFDAFKQARAATQLNIAQF